MNITHFLRSKQTIVFLLFTLSIFIKCVLFHVFCFDLPEGLTWKGTILFWMPKLAPAVFLGAFVFLFKRTWWTIVLSFLIDLWCVSNLIYFRINGLFLDFETIAMVGNMQGFWSSIIPFVDWRVFIFPCISLIFSIMGGGGKIRFQQRLWKQGICILLFQILVLAPIGRFNTWCWRLDNEPHSKVAGIVSLFLPNYFDIERSIIGKMWSAQKKDVVERTSVINEILAFATFDIAWGIEKRINSNCRT